MPKTFLLTDEFPPVQTGIARLMGEIARRYPKGELLVSTGQHRDASETDGAYATATLDRLPLSTRALRNIIGLMLWSRRVASLARQHKPRFAWCDSIRPAGYPAKWTHERVGTKYGVLVHGGDLLKELHGVHHSRRARRTARALLGSAVSVVANSQWTREQAQKVLRELGLDPLAEHVKVVPLGTDPEQFKPGDAVRFTGNVPDRDLPALYNTAQVYLGVSRRADATRVEGFGVALAEASACGLPVIAGQSGGLAEAIKDGDTGFVVEPTDVDAVTVALQRLLADQLLARRVGQAARKAVESYYNWDRVVRDLREIESQIA